MFPHQAMQDRLLRPPPLVPDRVRRRGAQNGFAFQSQKSATLRLSPLPYSGHCSPAPAICPYNLTN